MTTSKDLVEAHSFTRRRLVTAFVSGAPGGHEVEPARPFRAVVGGVALGVLLVAGAAVARVLAPGADPTWAQQPGLVISREEGAVFAITEASSTPVLRPVLNVTSAKLVLGPDLEPRVVPEEQVAAEQVGRDLGIVGAPHDVPDVERLAGSGWTACTDGDDHGRGGVRLALGRTEQVTGSAADGGLLVSVDGETWVVAPGRPPGTGTGGARRHRVTAVDPTRRLVLLETLGLGTEPVAVGRDWLGLVPEGAEITAGEALGETRWPTAPLRPVPGERCVRLVAGPGAAPRVEVVEDPRGDAAAAGTTGVSVAVEAGSGALVRPGGWGTTEGGGPVLVDARGATHPLLGSGTADLLGYGGYDAPVVPESWLALLDRGVPLSREAALCGPAPSGVPCE